MQRLWSRPLKQVIEVGFSDDELQAITEAPQKKTFHLPWLFWTTELYSFGKCLREWLSWPVWLPIPFYSDHGVCEEGLLAPHEQENASRYHFLWGQDRHIYASLFTTKRIIRVPHPWITYRHKQGYKPKPDRYGTLVFFPHSTMGIETDNDDLRQYVKDLLLLPSEYTPLVLCLHMHDINKGLHKFLRSFGFSIVSAGNTSSPLFVDRFYDLLSYFRYATSPSGGSELFYCYEFGVKYFIYGFSPTYTNVNDPNLPLGKLECLDIVHQKNNATKIALFKGFNTEHNAKKTDFVLSTLGLNCSVDVKKVRSRMFFELLRLLPYYFLKILFPKIVSKLNKRLKKKSVDYS